MAAHALRARPVVRVNWKGADRAASGHPWIFTSDVIDRGPTAPGDAVTVLDPRGRVIGTAHYSSTSQICLRLLADTAVEIDRAFYRMRIAAAQAYRNRVAGGENAYRLVYADADLLPGLIVDRYADCFVIQTLDQGMDRARGDIVACLEERYAPRAIVARNDAAVRKHESLPLDIAVVAGELAGPVEIRMKGLQMTADLLAGQKTGVYLDQRENYRAAAEYAHGRALDCFTSTGGFALHMAARCESVIAIDSSAAALVTARDNAARNGIGNIDWREANVFDALAAYAVGKARFDTVVLDPPAFAKSRANVDAAARAYKEINLRALKLLGGGGMLVSCSCSHHVSEAMLMEIVAAASLDAGRKLRVVERRMQARDHPVLLTVPETLYLKCSIFEVTSAGS